ncbi:hypothetical protein Tco_0668957 [Tanacetum coccineum]
MTIAIERSKIQTHSSHASGSGDGVDIQSKVPDEQQQNLSGTNEGAGDKPKVPDVPEYRSESEEESWTFSQGEDEEEDEEHDSDDDNDDNDDEDDDQEHGIQRTESYDSGDDFVHPNLSTYKANEEEQKKEEEKAEDDDEDDDTMGGEQEDEELYGDLNINLNRRDAEMTDAQINQETEEAHVTLTTEPPVVQQQSSSVSSDLVAKFINPSPDTGINSLLNQNVAVSVTPSSDTTIPQPPIPIIQPQQQTHVSTTTTIPTTNLPEIPNFASLFSFDLLNNYLTSKMKDEVNVDLQLKSDKYKRKRTRKESRLSNSLDFQHGKRDIIHGAGQRQNPRIMSKVENKDVEHFAVQTRGRSEEIVGMEGHQERKTQKAVKVNNVLLKVANRSSPKSSAKSNQEEEHEPRVADLEEPLYQEFNTGNDASPIREVTNVDDTIMEIHQALRKLLIVNGNHTNGTTSSFNKFLVTPIDFSAFMMNWTQHLKSNCKSVERLEHNPEGRPLSMILASHFPLMPRCGGCQIPYLMITSSTYGSRLSKRRKLKSQIYQFQSQDKGCDNGLLNGLKTRFLEVHGVRRLSKIRIMLFTSLRSWNFFGYKHLDEITGKDDESHYDDMDINRLMCTDELHKFSDDTLNHVRTSLNDIATGIQMEYLPKRKWSKQRQQESPIDDYSIDKKTQRQEG